MKRAIFFILLISLPIFPIYQLVNASPNGVKLSTYTFHSITFSNQKPALGEMIYLPETAFNEAQVLLMINNLEKIDHNILKLAEKQKIKIILFQGRLTELNGLSRFKDKKPRGYSESDPTWDSVPGMSADRVVYAKIGHSEYGKGHTSISLELHEIAHAIDRYVFNNVRDNPLFTEIWKLEVNRIFPSQEYYLNYSEEYFAESFAMFYFSPETNKELFEKAPHTFSFIQSLEEEAEKRLK